MLIRLADEMGFKIATFQHVLEGYKVAKEIAAHGAGARRSPTGGATRSKRTTRFPYNAAIMTRKGVLVSINSDSAEHARRLNTEAAKSMQVGRPDRRRGARAGHDQSAKQLRIDNRVGSLEVGKDADVVIWNHHPLSTYAIVDRVYIDGTVYYDRQAKKRASPSSRRRRKPRGRRRRHPRPRPRRRNAEGQPGRTVRADHGRTMMARGRRNDRIGVGFAWRAGRSDGEASRGWHRRGHRDHQRAIVPITRPAIERGTIVIRGNGSRRSAPTSPCRRARRSIDAAGAEVYPGFIDARTDIGLNEPGAARLRRRQRDARPQPDAAHARRVSGRQRRHSRRARRTASRPSPSCPAAARSAARSR